jgi:hypothetical protein
METTPYPFGDWATLTNDEGTFLPEGTFLDASFYIVGAGPRCRLSKIVVADQLVSFYIGDESNAELAVGELSLVDSVAEISFVDAFGRPAGIMISSVERLLSFQTWTLGTHTFTFAQTGFTPTVCLPVPNTRFRGFILDDGSVFTGDIWLVGDDGIVLNHEEITDEADSNCMNDAAPQVAGHYIRVDVVGDPLFRQRLCANVSATPKFLKTITFKRGMQQVVVGPDSTGEIKLLAGRVNAESTILRIRPQNGTIRIETVGSALEGNNS